MDVLRKPDLWGAIGTGLGQGIIKGSEQRSEELSQQRQLQQKQQMAQQEEERKESKLKEAIQAAYNDPDFQDEDFSKRQSVLWKHIAPVNPQVANYIASQDVNAMKATTKKGQQLPDTDKFKQTLLDNNYDPAEAESLANLYEQSSVGGRTQIIKDITEQIQRKKEEPVTPIEDVSGGYQWPEAPKTTGLTDKEKVKFRQEREKHNLPIYDETNKKLQYYEEEKRAIDRLSQLNDSDFLPEGFEKWNIDWKTGQPEFPAQLTPEAQLFVKTIYDFTTKAKDSFPGRVTNFDLETFLRRLPNLANSKDGRSLILKQMHIANQIANLREDSLLQTYNRYGVGNINSQEASKIANDRYATMKVDLEERLKTLDGMLEDKSKNVTSKTPEKPISQKSTEQPKKPVLDDRGRVKVIKDGKPGSVSKESYDRNPGLYQLRE